MRMVSSSSSCSTSPWRASAWARRAASSSACRCKGYRQRGSGALQAVQPLCDGVPPWPARRRGTTHSVHAAAQHDVQLPAHLQACDAPPLHLQLLGHLAEALVGAGALRRLLRRLPLPLREGHTGDGGTSGRAFRGSWAAHPAIVPAASPLHAKWGIRDHGLSPQTILMNQRMNAPPAGLRCAAGPPPSAGQAPRSAPRWRSGWRRPRSRRAAGGRKRGGGEQGMPGVSGRRAGGAGMRRRWNAVPRS